PGVEFLIRYSVQGRLVTFVVHLFLRLPRLLAVSLPPFIWAAAGMTVTRAAMVARTITRDFMQPSGCLGAPLRTVGGKISGGHAAAIRCSPPSRRSWSSALPARPRCG